MKKTQLLAVLLCLVLTLSFTGCSGISLPGMKSQDRQQLETILNKISENLHPGTAGSSLQSLGLTTELINWASSTGMTREEAEKAVKDWVSNQTPELQEAFGEQMESISATFGQILRTGGSDLLESAGLPTELPKIDGSLTDILHSILASGGLD